MEDKTAKLYEAAYRKRPLVGDRGGPGSLAMQEDDTTRQRELAVIRAAREAVNDQPDARDRPSSWAKLALLEEEVKALDALTASQPVDSQTLKPGQIFKYPGDEHPDRCRAWRKESGEIGYQNLDRGPKFIIYDFEPEDVVIPLPDDTE